MLIPGPLFCFLFLTIWVGEKKTLEGGEKKEKEKRKLILPSLSMNEVPGKGNVQPCALPLKRVPSCDSVWDHSGNITQMKKRQCV